MILDAVGGGGSCTGGNVVGGGIVVGGVGNLQYQVCLKRGVRGRQISRVG